MDALEQELHTVMPDIGRPTCTCSITIQLCVCMCVRRFFLEKLLRGGEIEMAVCEGGIYFYDIVESVLLYKIFFSCLFEMLKGGAQNAQGGGAKCSRGGECHPTPLKKNPCYIWYVCMCMYTCVNLYNNTCVGQNNTDAHVWLHV